MRQVAAVHVLCVFSLICVVALYFATLNVQESLSPQGCRMSWMSPSYILQTEFNTSWTPLAHRYSLWLYREVGWEGNEIHGRQPVLFIPGNAGSSHQVRSIASSAVRQFYSSPRVVSSEFATRTLKPIDTFAVEFNEDLSAFHGPTVEAQIRFTSDAIAYILSRYSSNTTIIILGHSMGGIVATSLLPSDDIAAIITMSTPHTLPPARFDSRIDRLYDRNRLVLKSDPTPIMSLCGGATDMMIPSESCILPGRSREVPYRMTIFTSALEGAWTGVGHREMVWCHQIRWRVARAALELQSVETDRKAVLDRWLRDGTQLPLLKESPAMTLPPEAYRVLPEGERLVLDRPTGEAVYVMPMTEKATWFTLYVSRGVISSISAHKPFPLEVSLQSCLDVEGDLHCTHLKPSSLRLIPRPIPGRAFPAPKEGSDESEGVVLYEADVTSLRGGRIAIRLERAQGIGWILADISASAKVTKQATLLNLAFGRSSIVLRNTNDVRMTVAFPNLLQHALVVYRVTPRVDESCKTASLPPLLLHRSGPSEVHYYPLLPSQSRQILLHSHSAGPFVDATAPIQGLNMELLSSGCALSALDIEVAWIPTLGRWASRYFTSAVCWAIGIVAFMLFDLWSIGESGVGPLPTVGQSLNSFLRHRLPTLVIGSFFVSAVPFGSHYYLGNSGTLWLSPIAPFLVLIASGLVCFSSLLLCVLLWPFQLISNPGPTSVHREVVTRGTLVSIPLILLAVFLFVPWQVAFLGCWIVHFMTCASISPRRRPPLIEHSFASNAIPLIDLDRPLQIESTRFPGRGHESTVDEYNGSFHLLLFMTWLLPITAPVLVVWARTLATAGLTTPFDGDHFVLNVAPFLVLVDSASRGHLTNVFERHSLERRVSGRWSLLIITVVAVLCGSRKAYMVFDTAKLSLGILVALRMIPRYWKGL